jgi:hypothetical protein
VERLPHNNVFLVRILGIGEQLISLPRGPFWLGSKPASRYPKEETSTTGVRSLTCGPRNMSPRLAAAAAASALPLPLPPPAVAAPSRALRALVLSPGAAAAVSSSLRRRGAPACLVRRLCSSHHSSAAAATAATAVEEARRGRKQLGMTPPLYDYLLANVREHPVRHSLYLPVPVWSQFATNFGGQSR